MKFRFLIIAATIAVMAACSTGKNDKEASKSAQAEGRTLKNPGVDMYFQAIENNTYLDTNAEFDTLSYAVGVNYAMAMQGLYLEGGLDRELFMRSFNDAVETENIDPQRMYFDIVANREFQDACYTPYNRAKQRQKMLERQNPDTLIERPTLFNEEFNMNSTAGLLGRHMANQLRIMALPVNLHWVREAFEDVKMVEDITKADSLLLIPVTDMVSIYRSYIPNQVSTSMAEQSEMWLANIAKQDGVIELCEQGMDSPIYYRIDKAGNERRPQDLRDSINIDYMLYSCHGILVESNEERIASLERQLARVKRSNELDEETREKLSESLEMQLEHAQNTTTTLGGFFQDVIGKCLPNIGEGGEITIWMPASYAPGVAMNSRGLAYPNEALVFNIELRKVTPVSEQIKPMPKPISKDAIYKPNNNNSNKGLKVQQGHPKQLTPKGKISTEKGPVTITPVKSIKK